MLDYYRDLAEQLAAMPGGHENLRTEFFASVTTAEPVPARDSIITAWKLKNEGLLALLESGNGGAKLAWLGNEKEEELASFPHSLLAAANEFHLTPIGLALLALAMGGVDDKRLKTLLPELHKASKGLLLIAVCRLCG